MRPFDHAKLPDRARRSLGRSLAPSQRPDRSQPVATQPPWAKLLSATALRRRPRHSTRLDAIAVPRHDNEHDHIGGEFLELVPHERIRYTDRFDDPSLPGVIQVTVTLKPVSCGTDLDIVQEGVPAIIPAEACYLGWQQSLALLALLVEAEVTQSQPSHRLRGS